MKKGFTMAEALIVMTIIGVVAAVTMPVLQREISLKVDSEREANIALKVTKAMESMSVAGELTTFASTDDFVDVLQKYLKITKRCSADKLNECWPTDTIIDSTGRKVEVNSADTGEKLHVKGNTTDNVGLVLADGASIILTYNQDFKGFSPYDFFKPVSKTLPIGFGKEKEFPYYRSTVTEPIDFIMDVNGSGAPNQETEQKGEKLTYHDIRSLKYAALGYGVCPGTRLPDGLCYRILSGFDPIDCRSINTAGDDWKYCVHGDEENNEKWAEAVGQYNNPKSADYWAGSFKACEKIDMTYYSDYDNAATLISQGIIPDVLYFQKNLGGEYNGNRFRLSSYRIGTYGLNAAGTSVICVKE